MISQTAEYALRAVVVLAAGDGEPLTKQGIAESTKVPPEYLYKVLQSLRRSGVITSQRGQGGGYVLARPATDISVYEVIQAVDPIARIRACPLGMAEHDGKLCALHSRLDSAIGTVENAFRATSIAELLDAAPNGRPLCC